MCGPECDVPVPGIPSTWNCSFFWWYRNKLVPEKSFGTGIGKFWYRKILVPGKSLGTGIGKIWYRKKSRNRYRNFFYTGIDFFRQNVGILKLFDGYWYRIDTGTWNFSFYGGMGTGIGKIWCRKKVSEPGIGEIWYRKKVLKPVSERFGTDKKYRYRYQKYLVPEKSIGISIV